MRENKRVLFLQLLHNFMKHSRSLLWAPTSAYAGLIAATVFYQRPTMAVLLLPLYVFFSL